MSFDSNYDQPAPDRTEVDTWTGPAVLEFGAEWCGICQAAQAAIESAVEEFPAVRHVKVSDGPGKPLGRSFRVKLWPTLVFLRNGTEVTRVVRPGDIDEIRTGLRAISDVQPG